MSDMQPVTTLPPVRVWQMNDCDWVAARSLTDAIDCYMQFSGALREDVLAEEPRQLTDADMRRLTFFCDEDEIPGVPKRHAFAVELKRLEEAGAAFPRFFASTGFRHHSPHS